MRKTIDRVLLTLVIILGIYSIVMIMSSTLNSAMLSNLYIKQGIVFIIGFFVMLVLKNFPYKILEEVSPFLFIISLLLLITVLIFGAQINGSRRWINLGIILFQPVELAKITVILLTALIIEKTNKLLFTLAPAAVVAILVLLQPDAGSALLFIPVWAAMIWVSKINSSLLVFFFPFLMICAATVFAESYLNIKSMTLLQRPYIYIIYFITLMWLIISVIGSRLLRKLDLRIILTILVFFWMSVFSGVIMMHFLKVYQKERIISFIMPEVDPLGAGYNIRQSLLAIGSGRLLGKGLFAGTQNQLGFLPVKHNDFIFAVIAEETGFIGSMVFFIFLIVLLWQIIIIAERTDDYGGRLIATGIFAAFFTQTVLNIGVSIAVFPVMGIQLPLISYGGTGTLVFMSMIGILMNINRYSEIIGR